MSCPSDARLAAATSREDADAAAHATRCLRCARIIEDQRATIALLAGTAEPALPERSRAELAAEILARADTAPARRPLWSAGIVAVAAATTAILAGPRDASMPPAPVAPEPVHAVAPAAAPPVAEPPAPPVAEPPAPPVTEPPAPPVTATRPAHIEAPEHHAAHPRPQPKPEVHEVIDPKAASVAAFRSGWEALGSGRNTDAIVAFDRATDPVVAEDAAFWAAVAADRAGDREAAARRFRDFLATFPQSPHADAARAALAR